MFKRLRARSSVSQSLGTHELELAKHFRILRTLGQGGYSTVYVDIRATEGRLLALQYMPMPGLAQACAWTDAPSDDVGGALGGGASALWATRHSS